MNTSDQSNSSNESVLSRRALLRTAAVGACGAMIARAESPTTQPAAETLTIPTNTLGRTGVKVTRIALGAGYPSYQERLLELAYQNGVRYFDNAYGYGNGAQERILGEWINKTGRRKGLFVVTKDGITAPNLFYDKVCRRLEALQLDTVDMMFIHALDQPDVVLDADRAWTNLKNRLVRENKIRFMGFSTHAEMPTRIALLENAARSPWVDALLCATDPLILRTNEDFSRALDKCVKANVGLVCMKTTRGLGAKAAQRRGVPEGMAPTENMPGFAEQGISAFAAVHRGIWSDGRFAALISAMLDNAKVEENTRNAREFNKPLTPEQWEWLISGMRKLASARGICPNCDGSCRRAAGTQTDFCSIARYVAYADEDGNRDAARQWFRSLRPEQQDWTGADLAAASKACQSNLDFKAILTRAERLLLS